MRGLREAKLRLRAGVSRTAQQRSVALFLLVAFLAGTVAPAGSAYATARTPKQKDVAPIAEQQAAYDTIPTVEPLSPVNEQVKSQTPEQDGQRPKFDPKATKKTHENADERTLQSRSYELDNGAEMTETSAAPQNYKAADGTFKPINPLPERDSNYEAKNKVPESFWDRILPGSPQPVGYKAVEGSVEVYFETIGKGGIRVVADGRELKFTPDTDKTVKPELKKLDNGDPYILYADVWPGVDLYYAYNGSSLKEYIRLNKKTSQSSFGFKLDGATVVKGDDGKIAFDGPFAGLLELGDLSVNVNKQGPLQEAKPVYAVGDNGATLAVTIDGKWLGQQNKDAFPMVIDPAIFDETWIPGGDFGDFKAYKSDGYYCSPQNCNVNIGGLNQAGVGARYWRSMVRLPYEHIMGRQLLDAYVYLEMTNIAGWAGNYDNRTIWVTWAPCFGYGCTNGGAPQVSGVIGGSGWINVRDLLEWMKNNNVQGGWLIFWGEETTSSYKQIRPAYMRLDTYTNANYPNKPNPELPSTNPSTEVVAVTTNPQLRVSAVTDPNGDTPIEYYAQVKSSNGTVLWGSGWSQSRAWTLPDGILQDGLHYTWEYIARDSFGYQTPTYQGGKFNVNLRTGKDKTQTYDSSGPLDISLNTGNVISSVDTHSVSALGGSIGLELDYNSPLISRPGLYAQYYDNNSWSNRPVYTRFEQNIDYDWDLGSPVTGVVPTDNFSAKWSGYFVAPYTGTFTFGTANDDYMRVELNGQTNMEVSCCSAGAWSATPVNLTEGQVVKLDVWYKDLTWNAYARLRVKSNVDPTGKAVPVEWLRTAPTPVRSDAGLTGHYYIDDGSHNPNQLATFMNRTDERVEFAWPEAPIPGAPADNFMVRWEGYFTAPIAGNYYFGGGGDDGYRVFVNNVSVTENWAPHGYLASYATTPTFLTAGQSIPIKMDYFESGGPGRVALLVDGPIGKGVIDSRYLSTGKSVLPSGWNISADVDGDLAYEQMKIRQNGDVVLYDADGSEHLYTTTGTGYKPPVNEDGQLVRNADYTYTLTDSDGRTYVFTKDGQLQQTTTPPDDRKPAALQYTYAVRNGMPALVKISDSVDPSRNGNLLYGDSGQCTAPPSGFIAAPTNYLCAFVTSDGQRTDFFYTQDSSGAARLARVGLPGNAKYDMGYDANGMLASIRDVLANDTIAAGVRADDATTKTEAAYDLLARISSATVPAANAGDTRASTSYDYTLGTTKTHSLPGSEPNGYTDKIDYDSLYRTVKDYDKTGQFTTTEWDPAKDLSLSTTDATGLKSTTIYDAEDRPTDTYGPAPAAWFGTDRKPLAAYVNQVPHTQTNYDEGMIGAAVAWYNFKGSSLVGAPRIHATGFNPADPSRFWTNTTNPSSPTVPITPTDGATNVGFRATAKIYAPTTGTYNLYLIHGNAARVWVDDKLVIDDWSYRSNTTTEKTVQIALTANKPSRLLVEYANVGGGETIFRLELSGNGVTSPNGTWGSNMRPDYNLTTSTKVFDPQTGDVTNTTNFGSKPELGQANSTVEDVGGLNLATNFTYEPYQAGSLMRQTSKTLPGGNTFNYQYYGATETRANPCVANSAAVSQAGMAKGKAEPDPDGAGPQAPRTTETAYDTSGRVVATRYNNEAWTCTTYDARGRVFTTSTPAGDQWQPARTITNNYAVGGNPLITSTADEQGTITVETDLLGRTIKYTDASGNQTTSAYDDQGHLVSRDGPLGHEEVTYDAYDRLVDQKLDGTVYAHVNYDQYSRIDNVTYPDAGTQKVTYARDTLGRLNGLSYDGLIGGTTTTTTGPGPNLITNPSLETPDSSDPNAPNLWYQGNWGSNSAVFSYANDGHTGSHSVKTQITNYTDGDAKWYFTPVNVSGNTNYTFTDWYKSDTDAEVVVEFTNQDGSLTYTSIGTTAAASAWTQTSYSFTAPSTAIKLTVYHLLAKVGWLQIDDADLHVTSQTTTATTGATPGIVASDTVTRSVTGDILSGTENGSAKSYSYDTAGRLTSATIGTNTYGYNYSAPTAAQCGQASANLSANKNSNRTSMTINGVTTTYCYDYADRLISSSDPSVNNPVYDAHGNMVQIGPSSNALRLPVDSSDRNRGVEQYDNNGNGQAIYYTRDAQGRIIDRDKMTISNWNWIWNSDAFYGFTGSGDTPDFVKDASGNMTERYLQLPGNVLLTLRGSSKTYSLPNIHGDVFATTDATGTLTSTYTTGPFGEPVSGQTNPGNTVQGTTYSYVGQHQKMTESDFTVSFIQMGARVYIPILGRFIQVDPVEGGGDNNYVYPGDPVNDFDLEGNFGWKKFFGKVAVVASVASVIPGPVGMVAAGVATACYAGTGNYKAAAAAAVGFIPGGKAVSAIASKTTTGARVLTKLMDTQAKMKGIGVSSKFFGNYSYSGKAGILNGRYVNSFKAGWANNNGRLAYRIKLPLNYHQYVNTSRITVKFLNYGVVRKIRVRM